MGKSFHQYGKQQRIYSKIKNRKRNISYGYTKIEENKMKKYFKILSVIVVLMSGVLLVTGCNKKKQTNKVIPIEDKGPSLLLNTNGNYTEPTVDIKETTALVALRVEAEEEMMKEIEDLKLILMDDKATIEEKNEAFEKMKTLNTIRGEEEKLEEKIKNKFNLEAFVKIKNDQIEIVVKQKERSASLANKIIRSVQEEYQTNKYITIKFTA